MCWVTVEDRGFSLVELMIALFILAVGLLATATILTTGMGSNRRAQAITVETGLAYSVLDEVMARSLEDSLFKGDQKGIVYDLDPSTPATTLVVQGVEYSATLNIDRDNPVKGVTRVEVVISGGGRTTRLTTFRRTI